MIRNIVLLLLTSLLFSCMTQGKVEHAQLIAHAGGSIDGNIYTNSMEAMHKAARDGYEFIEFDLMFTSDSVLVAAHSWSEFNTMTGYGHKGDSAPDLKDFISRRIYNRYTPLSAADINEFFSERPDLYLVTDKVSDSEILSSYFPELKERMVVEAFSYKDYCRLVEDGYFRVMYSCMASDLDDTLMKNLLFDKLFPGKRVEWITLHTSGFESRMFIFLNTVRKFNIALFTVDDYKEIPEKYKNRASMIYTNGIMPNKEK